MSDTFSRSLLEPDRLYYCIPTGQWFSTPDGVGCFFYDSREQGLEQTGADEQHIRFINQPLADY